MATLNILHLQKVGAILKFFRLKSFTRAIVKFEKESCSLLNRIYAFQIAK